MSMIEPRLRNIYLQFYKESYFTPSALDLKTKELIAIGIAAAAVLDFSDKSAIKLDLHHFVE